MVGKKREREEKNGFFRVCLVFYTSNFRCQLEFKKKKAHRNTTRYMFKVHTCNPYLGTVR